MKRFFIFYVFYFGTAMSQNLIPNYSFEQYSQCPFFAGQWDFCADWNNVNMVTQNFSFGTPDYYNVCGSGFAQLPNSFLANISPSDGNGLMGIVIYNSDIPDYREYISCQLNSTLNKEFSYNLSFKVSGGNNQNYRFHSDKLNVVLSTMPLFQSNYNLINSFMQFEIDTILNTNSWVSYNFSFIPDSNYAYLTIGNFLSDQLTNEILVNNSSLNKYSVIYLDEVELSPNLTGFEQQSNDNPISIEFNPNNRYIRINGNIENLISSSINTIDGKEILPTSCFDNRIINIPQYLESGIYFVNFYSTKGVYTKKIFIVN